tara:strand:+ start:560 stop:1033 length:474 start_codon:yes stop_codon:yes gene_type:complete
MSFTKDNNSDNFSTNEDGWKSIKNFIPKNKIIWSPFYSDGKQKEYFKKMGINILHEDKNFFEYTPEYDIIVDNPPFSKLREILAKLKDLDKPFILLMPSSKFNAKWFQNDFGDHLQMLIPRKKINFTNLNPEIKFNFNWGTYFYCYKMELPKDLIFY